MARQASNGFRTILFQLLTDPARPRADKIGPLADGAVTDRLARRT